MTRSVLFLLLASCAYVTDDEVDAQIDADGDGFAAVRWEGTDCNDGDATIFPTAEEVWYDGVDQDCSGDTDFDQDGDGFAAADYGGADCNDTSALANPALAENPGDGLDNDCDGMIDETPSTVDADGDGWTEADGDCDDDNQFVNPDMEEVYYNGFDDDCDPETRDMDKDGDGWDGPTDPDCDDENPNIHPGATENVLTGQIDEDCDGSTIT